MLRRDDCTQRNFQRYDMRHFIRSLILFALVSSGSLHAQKGRHLEPLSWDHNISRMVRRYCYSCHNDKTTEGTINLERDANPRQILEHRDAWAKARAMLESRKMPPDSEKQPTDEDRKLIIEFITTTLDSIDCTAIKDPGPPPFRRLNNVEYNNTIQDLTGLDLHPADGFSPDPSSFGFDNIGETLTLSPVQVEQYHKAAREVTNAILAVQPNGGRHWLLEVDSKAAGSPRDQARSIISRFATRAFRRPVDADYLEKLTGIYDSAVARGEMQDQSVGHALTATMMSLRFLIRLETIQPDHPDPYPVDDYELASRLSYFLWSRPPDDTLLEVASREQLGNPAVLEEQTRRMLADPRSRALAENFFGQWLELRQLKSHRIDDSIFADCSPAIRTAMADEVTELLAELIQKNRPVRELIDADHAYLNQDLARWYGIEGVTGSKLQRVALTDRRRGGILTTAAILMLQSDPGRTNIPRRGNFIAGRILGASPPPPPADVPELSPPEAGKSMTLRERLELHRKSPDCASCHSRIDPLGFSLENYDAVGRWRENDSGQPIDPSGELPSGRRIGSPVELKDVLLENEEAFVRTLFQNLLIYALGRGLLPEDECVIRDALEVARDHEGRFDELIVSIVQSYPFRYRKNPEF